MIVLKVNKISPLFFSSLPPFVKLIVFVCHSVETVFALFSCVPIVYYIMYHRWNISIILICWYSTVAESYSIKHRTQSDASNIRSLPVLHIWFGNFIPFPYFGSCHFHFIVCRYVLLVFRSFDTLFYPSYPRRVEAKLVGCCRFVFYFYHLLNTTVLKSNAR